MGLAVLRYNRKSLGIHVNRRTFLKAGSLAAGAAWAAEAFDTPSNPRKIRKAIMYETIKLNGTVLEKLQAVKAAGFEGVEPMSHMSQQEVLDAMKTCGLAAASVCCSTHWKKPLSDPSPAVREEGLRGLEQALRDAKAYGASSVLLVPAVVNKQVSYADAYTRSQTEIRKALPLAEQLGVKIAVENVWNQFLMSPLEAARFIDEFNSSSIGWHFDIGNVITYGWPEQWIHILGRRILKLHVKEYSRAKRDKTGPRSGFDVKFLEGDNDWPAVMKALDDVGYTGWGIAEQPGADSPEGLKDLSSRMDRIFAS
jgi:hexulose-6-phosphate isomerase